jgi:hypothetical protein
MRFFEWFWNQDLNFLTDDFLCGVAKQALCTLVEDTNGAGSIDCDYSIGKVIVKRLGVQAKWSVVHSVDPRTGVT